MRFKIIGGYRCNRESEAPAIHCQSGGITDEQTAALVVEVGKVIGRMAGRCNSRQDNITP
jgi:hypothetical protein